MNVLYIEDDKLVQRTVVRFLKRRFVRINITTCEDANVAIALLDEDATHYTHILCDYDLANGTRGDQVYNWLTDSKPQMLGKLTFLSANDACKKLHHRCIEKPASADAIANALLEVSNG